MIDLLLQIKDAVPQLETGTPTSIGAWLGMITGPAAFILVAYDRLRGSGKRESDMNSKVADLHKDFVALGKKVDILEHELNVIEVNLSGIDKKLTEVLFELRGFDGHNGAKGNIKMHSAEIAAINKRLAAMDVVAAILKAENDYNGPEKRHSVRRSMDSKLLEIVSPPDESL